MVKTRFVKHILRQNEKKGNNAKKRLQMRIKKTLLLSNKFLVA